MKSVTPIKARREENEKLLERLAKFSEDLIDLAQKLPKTVVNLALIRQGVASGTSIGANYNEACEAESAKDFVHKIKISIKEGKETQYWLRLLAHVKENAPHLEEIKKLHAEADEFVRIFSSIVSKFRH